MQVRLFLETAERKDQLYFSTVIHWTRPVKERSLAALSSYSGLSDQSLQDEHKTFIVENVRVLSLLEVNAKKYEWETMHGAVIYD